MHLFIYSLPNLKEKKNGLNCVDKYLHKQQVELNSNLANYTHLKKKKGGRYERVKIGKLNYSVLGVELVIEKNQIEKKK